MLYKAQIPEKFYWEAELDFYKDFSLMSKKYLKNLGFSADSSKDPLLEYCKVLKHSIPKIPRKVYKSDAFSCPQGYEVALANFDNKVKQGKDLTPFLTSKYKSNANYNDSLLNQWGIFHFHLTNRFNDDGTAKRNKYLIMGIVRKDSFYEIFIKEHNDIDCFNDKKLLEIVNRNWPNIIEHFVLKGAQADVILDNSDIKKMFAANINVNVTLSDNTVITSPGGGTMTDGTSMEAQLKRIDIIHACHNIEKFVAKNMLNIIESYMTLMKHKPPKKMHFKLIECDSRLNFVCKELSNKFTIIKKDKKFELVI